MQYGREFVKKIFRRPRGDRNFPSCDAYIYCTHQVSTHRQTVFPRTRGIPIYQVQVFRFPDFIECVRVCCIIQYDDTMTWHCILFDPYCLTM